MAATATAGAAACHHGAMPSPMLAATVTPEEKEAFCALARARGVTPMSHLRRLIRDEIERNPTAASTTDDRQAPLFVEP